MKRFVIIILLLFYPEISYSQKFKIKDYNIDISIKKSGEIKVKEDILVSFSNPEQEFRRSLPLGFVDLKGVKREIFVYDIDVPSKKFRKSEKSGLLNISIGDNKAIYGQKRYTIKYSIYGAVTAYNDFDLIYLNLVGNNRDIVIDKIKFYIFLPDNFQIKKEDIRIFYHSFYESKDLPFFIERGMIYGETDNPLKPKEKITLTISLPKGVINHSQITKIFLIISENKIYAIPFLIFLTLFGLWWFWGKDETISKIIHYRPPAGLNPAIAGYLFNDRADNRDLIALLFYWAKEGIISIEEAEDPLAIIFAGKDFIIRQISPLPLDAKPFEWIIFNDLFPYQVKSVRISSLKDKFYTTMESARKELENYVYESNLYQKRSVRIGRFLKIIFTPVFSLGLYFIFLNALKLAVTLLISSLIILFFGLIMPKKSSDGNKIYEILSGFKNFLEKVEKPRLEKIMSKDSLYFNEILPYAIAFGIADNLADKFQGLFTKPPEWYKSDKNLITEDFFSGINIITSEMNKIFVKK